MLAAINAIAICFLIYLVGRTAYRLLMSLALVILGWFGIDIKPGDLK